MILKINNIQEEVENLFTPTPFTHMTFKDECLSTADISTHNNLVSGVEGVSITHLLDTLQCIVHCCASTCMQTHKNTIPLKIKSGSTPLITNGSWGCLSLSEIGPGHIHSLLFAVLILVWKFGSFRFCIGNKSNLHVGYWWFYSTWTTSADVDTSIAGIWPLFLFIHLYSA